MVMETKIHSKEIKQMEIEIINEFCYRLHNRNLTHYTTTHYSILARLEVGAKESQTEPSNQK